MIEIETIRWTTFRFTCDQCKALQYVDVDAWTFAVQVAKTASQMRRTVQCDDCGKAHTINVTPTDVGVSHG